MIYRKKPQTKPLKEPEPNIEQLREILNKYDNILIGAGAGLSSSAGYLYSGDIFQKYFFDFERKYDIHDMYLGGFTKFSSEEEKWAFWSRIIYLNRYLQPKIKVYEKLFDLVKNKNYFVLTTNVDQVFQRTGFPKNKVYPIQGEYGLFQCQIGCQPYTISNEELIYKMMENQGFEKNKDGIYDIPKEKEIKMIVDSLLLPKCKFCNNPMKIYFRGDNFIENEDMKNGSKGYDEFIEKYSTKPILFLELGVGYDTPGMIKFPFWKMTNSNENSKLVCINNGEAEVPEEIKEKSLCFNSDIWELIKNL